MKTVLIIPTLDEKETILGLVREALLYVDKVYVDDAGSTDGSLEELYDYWSLMPEPEQLKILTRPEGVGPLGWIINDKPWLGELFCGGFLSLMTMDAGGTHRPQDIPKFLEYMDSGAYVALGTRNFDEGSTAPWYRRLLSRTAGRIMGVPDATCGFRAYNIYWLMKAPHLYNDTGFDFHLPFLVLLKKTVGESFYASIVPIPYLVIGKTSLRLSSVFKTVHAYWKVLRRKVRCY